MNFRIILLMIYYIGIVFIGISEYLYLIKIRPVQLHIWGVVKLVLIWVIIACSGSLLFNNLSEIIVSHIACPILALIGFALEYDSLCVYSINCSGSDYENTIKFIKDYTEDNNNMIFEENRYKKAFGCKIRFQNIDRKRMKYEMDLLLLELKQNHVFIIKKGVIYSEIFHQFIVPTIFYCFLFYKILKM